VFFWVEQSTEKISEYTLVHLDFLDGFEKLQKQNQLLERGKNVLARHIIK
jgi:hypothetical protein